MGQFRLAYSHPLWGSNPPPFKLTDPAFRGGDVLHQTPEMVTAEFKKAAAMADQPGRL